VGYCYENKIGVKKNGRKVFEYYQKSADMGEVQGTNNAGHCYENGIGVERDIHIYEAFEYYKKSAGMGYAIGVYNVEYCYHYGNGVKKMSVKLSSIINNQQRWDTLMECTVLANFIKKDSLLKRI
ncbi:hypothetical protein C2G38_1987389, partial [Gigaspora rosea]